MVLSIYSHSDHLICRTVWSKSWQHFKDMDIIVDTFIYRYIYHQSQKSFATWFQKKLWTFWFNMVNCVIKVSFKILYKSDIVILKQTAQCILYFNIFSNRTVKKSSSVFKCLLNIDIFIQYLYVAFLIQVFNVSLSSKTSLIYTKNTTFIPLSKQRSFVIMKNDYCSK